MDHKLIPSVAKWNKACECYLVTVLNRTPIFESCASRSGSKNKHHKDTCLKEIDLRVIKNSTLNRGHNCRRTHVFSEGIKKHVLPITIIKSGEVRFSIRFLLMIHCEFANAIQVLLCESNWQKLENMTNGPNKTHTP